MGTNLFGERVTDPMVSGPTSLGKSKIFYYDAVQILNKPTGFIGTYDYTLTPYRGCKLGCRYCYAKRYRQDYEYAEEWGDWVKVKQNAIALLKKTRNSLTGSDVYMSPTTDCYQPIEARLELTRRLLQTMVERNWRPNLVVQTRAPLVARDVDVMRELLDIGGNVQVNMTVTTDDESIKRKFEPACAPLRRRLEAIAKVGESRIQTCITVTPFLGASDPEQFAADLIATGVRRFITQKFNRGTERFAAGTDADVLEILKESTNSRTSATAEKRYERNYEDFKTAMSRRPEVVNGKAILGESKTGFAPPFGNAADRRATHDDE